MIRSDALLKNKKQCQDSRRDEIPLFLHFARFKELCLRFCGHGGFLLHLSLRGSLLTEDSDGELFVVEAATAVSIIAVEEGAKLFGWEIHAAFFEHALELVEVNTARVHHVKKLEHLHEASLLRHLGI